MIQPVLYGLHNVPGAPPGLPANIPSVALPLYAPMAAAPAVPGQDLKRAITYLADHGGCGFYRCISPELMLNLHERAVIAHSTAMILDPRYYLTVEAVKFQRQASGSQKEFMALIKALSKQKKLKLIYEVDDVVFGEDIPLYNRNREAFATADIRNNIIEMLNIVDEITVTSEYFRDYVISKTGRKEVSSIPNYLPRWWFDRYYNLGDLVKKFERNKKRPVVSIFASGTHVDVLNRVGLQDDFEMIVPYIIKARRDFKWRFYGCHPMQVKPYIQSGEMEFIPWTKLPDYPASIYASDTQVTFAAIRDNEFNKCKSNIKLLEAGAMGIPCVCPDLVTYKDAPIKYSSGAEFIDCLKKVTKNQTVYADYCKKSRAVVDNFWLDDEHNYMKHYDALFTPFGSLERKYLK